LGTGEAVGLRLRTQALANGIPPNIAGNIFDWVAGPKDVVVITALPEVLTVLLFEVKRGGLFETIDELLKITGVVQSFGGEVQVIGHYAVGVQVEVERGGVGEEFFDGPRSEAMIGEERGAVLGADGDEIGAAADVVGRREAEGFVEEGHVGQKVT